MIRARLIIHERVRTLFGQSLLFARRTGYLQSRKLKVVLDTTYVLGRGAVDDLFDSKLEPRSFNLVHACFLIAPLGRGREQVAAHRRLLNPSYAKIC